MGSADWDFLNDGLDSASVARSVTSSSDPGPPYGGGSFYYGFDSKVDTDGAVGLTTKAATNPDFSPITKGGGTPSSAGGGSVRGAIMRGVSAQKTGFSPFLFIGLQAAATPSVNDQAYIIGLEDSDPYRIVVRKGNVINGVPSASSTNSLMTSTATYTIPSGGRWHHVRLDMIVNLSGDVILKAYYNDLTANPVTSPVWVPIPGCETFTDDALGVNSGSLPFTEGWAGYGFASTQMGRRGYFDQVRIARQLD